MQQYKLSAWNNATFLWTLDLTAFVAVYGDLSTATIRLQIKNRVTDATPALEFVTGGSVAAATYTSASKSLRFTAPQYAVAAFRSWKPFDIRIELATGEIVAGFGIIEFVQGVSTATVAANSGTGTGVADTVVVLSSVTIASLGLQSVTTDNLSALLSSAIATVTTEANLAIAAASTATAIANVNLGVWASRAAFAAASIPAGVSTVLVLGRAAIGDSPKAQYVKVGSMPSHPGRVQTADGAWWAISEPIIYPQQIQATGTGDDYAAIFNADLVALAIGAELVINQTHNVHTTLTIVSPVRFTLGGKVSPGGAITLTFNGGIVCPPLYQIFGMGSYTAASTVIKLHDISYDVTPFLFGAAGNSTAVGGGTPDDVAVAAAFAVAMASNLPLNLSDAIFLCANTLQVDLNNLGASETQGFTIYGSSPGSSGLYFSYSTANGNAFRLYTSAPSTQQIAMSNLMIAGSFPGVLCALGLDNFADNIVLSTFTNVRWMNSYLSATHQNEALRLNSANLVNFIGCQMNAYATYGSYVGPYYGYAIKIRQGQELSFTGCSIGNAYYAAAWTDSISYNCVFTGCGMENSNYAGIALSTYLGGGYHVFTGCYLADTTSYGFSNQSSSTSELFRVISSNTNPGTITIVDPSHYAGIVVEDLRAITTPAFPAAGVGVVNVTGKSCLVVLEGAAGSPTLTAAGQTVNGIAGQTISVVVRPGDTVSRTNGTAWVWYPI